MIRKVSLEGPQVRKARTNIADGLEGGEVFLYWDASVPPLLDLRRRLKAVSDFLDALIREGFSLAKSLELAAQWDAIFRKGSLLPVTHVDLRVACGGSLEEYRRIVGDLHRRLSEFIHGVVVHRRDEAIREGRREGREDPLVHPYRWLKPDLVPPASFLRCEPHLTVGLSGVVADPSRTDEEFRKAWLPYFSRSGQRETSLEEFNAEVDGWLPCLPVFDLPELTGEVRKGATTCGLL